ncbi:MAG: hypothetical protein CMJ39_11695 [Phycisphaerae bacterium]|nr:hypothetical protein [Phycisphaerae bacterium]
MTCETEADAGVSNSGERIADTSATRGVRLALRILAPMNHLLGRINQGSSREGTLLVTGERSVTSSLFSH